jgi:sulfatase modifying factor 1
MSSCCSPSNESSARPSDQAVRPTGELEVDLVDLPGGQFWMGAPEGDGYVDDGEGPVHLVQLDAFSIAPTTVTNADFAAFCEATGYVTLAER